MGEWGGGNFWKINVIVALISVSSNPMCTVHAQNIWIWPGADLEVCVCVCVCMCVGGGGGVQGDRNPLQIWEVPLLFRIFR